MANKSTNRGKGNPDMNVLAYETMLAATGQKPKTEPPKAKRTGVSLRKAAR